MTQRLLIVDDDPELLRVLRGYLAHAGYQVVPASRSATTLRLARYERPDLIVLDLMLPDRDGWEVLRVIRSDPMLAATPIMLLTARVEDTDKVDGLELGADDYMTKPFSPPELVARVKALIRRAHGTYEGVRARVLSVGGLRLDRTQHRVTIDARPVELTPTEFKLLEALMVYPGQTLTRDELLETALGYAYNGIGRVLDSHMRNLRRKIEPDADMPTYVQTVYGIGYRLMGER